MGRNGCGRRGELTGDVELALELATMLADQTRWAEAIEVVRGAVTTDRELELRLLALAADCARMDPGSAATSPRGSSRSPRRSAATRPPSGARWPRRP